MKHVAKPKVHRADTPELAVSSTPPDLLDIVRTGNAATLPTKQLNCFYVLADSVEKAIKALKEKCRPVIIARRDEGESVGADNQHREFVYHTMNGDIRLTVQERILQKPDPDKLEALLKSKNLWQSALTTTLDMDKVDGLSKAGLITAEELVKISDAPKPIYALIAKLDSR